MRNQDNSEIVIEGESSDATPDEKSIVEYLDALRKGDHFKFLHFTDALDKRILKEGKLVAQDTRQKFLQLMLQNADVSEKDLVRTCKLYNLTHPLMHLEQVDDLPIEKDMKWNFVYIAESYGDDKFYDYCYITRKGHRHAGSITKKTTK